MKTKTPLVSLLINNYNYGFYLQDAIESALNQTYFNTEVIVVDDGSTDNSREIIASYADKITPVLKENGGQPSAFNAGFAASKGEFICFLDSDDVWLPQKVEQVVQAAYDYPNASVVYHKVQNIDPVRIPMGKPWPPHRVIKGNIFREVVQTGGWWPFPPSTGLSFSRTFLDKVMNIPEQEYRSLGADSYLADLAPFLGEVVGIDQVLSLYRVHGRNQSNSWSKSQTQCLRYHEARNKHLNYILKNLDINVGVDLKNHWAYQRIKYQLDREKKLIDLSLLAFQNPWEPRIPSKLKTILKLWFETLGIGSSRV